MHMQPHDSRWLKRLFFVLIASVLGACGSQPTELPTLARIASDTPRPVATQALAQNNATSEARATLPATFTPTFTMTLTPTLTVTPSATITETPSLTPTDLPTIDPAERPLLGLLEAAREATVLPDDFNVPDFGNPNQTLTTPTVTPQGFIEIGGIGSTPTTPPNSSATCAYYPAGNFATIYINNPDIAQQLGCLSEPAETIASGSAWQNFENGIMIWLQVEDRIYVLNSVADTYQSYEDTFTEGSDPNDTNEAPPSGLFAPRRGFLKVWSQQPGVRDALGWATNAEQATTATIQRFPNGMMVSLPQRGDTLVFINNGGNSGIWQSFSGTF